jgi:hypothetical protein
VTGSTKQFTRIADSGGEVTALIAVSASIMF